jgi:hypothetical protein
MGHSLATPLSVADQHSGTHWFADHVLNARVELYACLQLLADRARFITGATWAAIALHEGEECVYCAAAGNSAPVIGSVLNLKTLPGMSLAPDGKSLLVRVIRQSKTEGFFQLVAGAAGFSDGDLQSIIRLAEMVSTAIDCMEAERQSITEHSTPAIPMAVAPSPKPTAPVLWHAPDGMNAESSIKSSARADIAICSCESCGFPVSRGRTICVDCEERGTPSATMARLLNAREKEESWFSAHGYTIASLVVSALVAAIIYWLH